MENTEIRVGNWILNGIGEAFKVNNSTIAYFDMGQSTLGEFKPIPLTLEWLLSLGFTKYEWVQEGAFIKFNRHHLMIRFYNNGIHAKLTKVEVDRNGQKMTMVNPVKINPDRLKYVHLLQNFYNANTGKELVKQPKQ